MPTISPQTDCCSPCNDVTVSQVPGPQGPAGTNGTNGTNGVSAFTTTSNSFTMPAVSAAVSIQVATSAWAALGQVVFIQNAGYFTVTGIADSTHITGTNLGYVGNAAPTTNIASASKVSPGGLKGVDGSSAGATLNAISPTTTKGDLIVDNGGNHPLAGDVRQAVGTNGQGLVSDSTSGTGVSWKSNIPNAATDKAVARFNGTTGTPVPLQTSKLVVTDNGAVQASGSGGNARGTDAVDLQVNRSVATQVASGSKSGILAGTGNTASNTNSVVGGGNANVASGAGASGVFCGDTNSATGNDSAVLGGNLNLASGPLSSVVGGFGNISAGNQATIGGGWGNSATGAYSAILGGWNALADKFGQQAFSSGVFAVQGDSQKNELQWRIGTSDATAGVEMYLDGVASRATMTVGKTWAFDILLVGRSSAGVGAAWTCKGAIQNNAGTTSLVAAVTTASIADGTGATWGAVGNFVVTADNANSSLKLAVTGSVATFLRWSATARIMEIGF